MDYSIIIPVYNGAQTLGACVESALALPGSEILLIDDGSTDASGGICSEFALKYQNIRVFHQKNQGVSAARNAGLAQAEGDRILFLDGDDTLNPSALEGLPDGDCVIFGGEGNLCLAELFAENLLTPVWNKVFRRELIEDCGLRFREDMFVYEDLDFSLRYLARCRHIVRRPETLCHHRPSGKALARVARLESLGQVLEPIRESLPRESAILPQLAEILAREMLAAKPGSMLPVWKEFQEYCPGLPLFRLLRGALARRWKP